MIYSRAIQVTLIFMDSFGFASASEDTVTALVAKMRGPLGASSLVQWSRTRCLRRHSHMELRYQQIDLYAKVDELPFHGKVFAALRSTRKKLFFHESFEESLATFGRLL